MFWFFVYISISDSAFFSLVLGCCGCVCILYYIHNIFVFFFCIYGHNMPAFYICVLRAPIMLLFWLQFFCSLSLWLFVYLAFVYIICLFLYQHRYSNSMKRRTKKNSMSPSNKNGYGCTIVIMCREHTERHTDSQFFICVWRVFLYLSVYNIVCLFVDTVWMREKEHVAWSDDFVPCVLTVCWRMDCVCVYVLNARWENCMTLFICLSYVFRYSLLLLLPGLAFILGMCVSVYQYDLYILFIYLKKSTGVAWQELNTCTLWMWRLLKVLNDGNNNSPRKCQQRKR